MKISGVVLIAGALVCFATLTNFPFLPGFHSEYRRPEIRGRVVDVLTNRPLSGVMVTMNEEENNIGTVTTDGDGVFVFKWIWVKTWFGFCPVADYGFSRYSVGLAAPGYKPVANEFLWERGPQNAIKATVDLGTIALGKE